MGVHPRGLTLRELSWMAHGKAELLGLTSNSPAEQRIEYDPALLQRMQTGT